MDRERRDLRELWAKGVSEGMSDENDLPRVHMEQAFRWFCPGCKTENFDRAVEVEFESREHMQEVCEGLGVDKYREGEIVEVPKTVTCRSCLILCTTDDPRYDPEEDDV